MPRRYRLDCSQCGRPIRDADHGAHCSGCDYPVHYACMRPSATAGRQTCSVCGIDLPKAAAGLPTHTVTPRRRSPLRVVLGTAFLALAACSILLAAGAVLYARSIRAAVGVFLLALVLMMVGLVLVRRPRG